MRLLAASALQQHCFEISLRPVLSWHSPFKVTIKDSMCNKISRERLTAEQMCVVDIDIIYARLRLTGFYMNCNTMCVSTVAPPMEPKAAGTRIAVYNPLPSSYQPLRPLEALASTHMGRSQRREGSTSSLPILFCHGGRPWTPLIITTGFPYN
jgi:hypothetical protein